jgi:hypothetical protein
LGTYKLAFNGMGYHTVRYDIVFWGNKRKRPLHNERWWRQQTGDIPVATNGDVKNSQVKREATVPKMKKGMARSSRAKRGGGTAGREAVVCREAEAVVDG